MKKKKKTPIRGHKGSPVHPTIERAPSRLSPGATRRLTRKLTMKSDGDAQNLAYEIRKHVDDEVFISKTKMNTDTQVVKISVQPFLDGGLDDVIVEVELVLREELSAEFGEENMELLMLADKLRRPPSLGCAWVYIPIPGYRVLHQEPLALRAL